MAHPWSHPEYFAKGKSSLRVGASPQRRGGLTGDEGAQPGKAVLPGQAPGFAGQCQQGLPVLGLRVLRAAIGVMGGSCPEEIKVDAVHGFRPKVDCPFGMPENLRYFESGKYLKRKLSLRHALARPALPLCPSGF